MGVPASGRHISVVGVGVMRVANGKVAEFWVSPDRMSLMQQIGALPVQEPANAARHQG
jgi:predicted ester cyclase